MKNKVFIHPTAEVSPSAKVGEGTKIWNQAQVREGASIGKNCILGKCVYVDKNVKIGNNVKLENIVSVYQGVTIEDDVFVGPHSTFTNDMYPRSLNKKWKIVPTLVKKGASIGANSTILCGVIIGKHAITGIGSVVTKDIPDYGLVYGNPARLKGFVCICGSKLKKIGTDKDYILTKCEKCGKKIKIEKKIFNQLG